jgi:hypothetical protein
VEEKEGRKVIIETERMKEGKQDMKKGHRSIRRRLEKRSKCLEPTDTDYVLTECFLYNALDINY